MIGASFFYFGAVFLVWSLYVFLKRRAFVERAQRLRGTVVALATVEPTSSDDFPTFAAVIEVDTGGQTVRFQAGSSARPAKARVGQEVPVLFVPDAPDQIVVDNFGELYSGAVLLAMVGAASTAFGVFLLLEHLRSAG